MTALAEQAVPTGGRSSSTPRPRYFPGITNYKIAACYVAIACGVTEDLPEGTIVEGKKVTFSSFDDPASRELLIMALVEHYGYYLDEATKFTAIYPGRKPPLCYFERKLRQRRPKQ